MISIPQPALALNSYDVPQPHYRMWNTGLVPADKPIGEIMNWINSVAASAPSGRLRALVLNCHGISRAGQLGYGLSIGAGINHSNVELFLRIRDKVDTIYITACGAGRIAANSTPGGAGDGHYLLSSIARNARANVIGSTELQTPPPSIPRNSIDSFEGLVVSYDSTGNYVRGVAHRSVWPSGVAGRYYGDNG